MNMADNYPSFDPAWGFQSAFPDFADAFSHSTETETLTRALQVSLSTEVDVLASVIAGGSSPFIVKPEPAASLSASDAETSGPKRARGTVLCPPGGKISKRKSRASKRSTTTYITADAANFRQMVQQVTGIRFPGAREATDAVLKPEPHRLGAVQAPLHGSCLPTLDTSSILLDRAASWSTPAPSPPSRGSSFGVGSPAPPETAVFDLDPPFPCFPTLESWGVMQ